MDGVPRLYAVVPMAQGRGFVTTGIPRSVAFAAARRILLNHLILVGVVTLLVVGVTEVAARVFILQWVNPLQATQRLSANDLTARAGVAGGPRELRELARGFDQMAESMQRRETKQKRAENSLRESEEMFRSLSASSPLGIFTTDLEGRWTYVNPPCRQLLGVSLTESASEGWLQRIHPEDRIPNGPTFSSSLSSSRAAATPLRLTIRDATPRRHNRPISRLPSLLQEENSVKRGEHLFLRRLSPGDAWRSSFRSRTVWRMPPLLSHERAGTVLHSNGAAFSGGGTACSHSRCSAGVCRAATGVDGAGKLSDRARCHASGRRHRRALRLGAGSDARGGRSVPGPLGAAHHPHARAGPAGACGPAPARRQRAGTRTRRT